MSKYELSDTELDEIYNHYYSCRQQFVHQCNPTPTGKLTLVEEILDDDEDYIFALILCRDTIGTFEDAYEIILNYSIFDNEESRNSAFEEMLIDQTQQSIEDAIVDGTRSWLYSYIDIETIIDDRMQECSYAEVLSNYEEEIEATVAGVTYYMYRNS